MVQVINNQYVDLFKLDFMKFKEKWEDKNIINSVEFKHINKPRCSKESPNTSHLVIKMIFKDEDTYRKPIKKVIEETENDDYELDVNSVKIEKVLRHIHSLAYVNQACQLCTQTINPSTHIFVYNGKPDYENLKIKDQVSFSLSRDDYSLFKYFFESQCVNLINYVLIAAKNKEMNYKTAVATLGPLLDVSNVHIK